MNLNAGIIHFHLEYSLFRKSGIITADNEFSTDYITSRKSRQMPRCCRMIYLRRPVRVRQRIKHPIFPKEVNIDSESREQSLKWAVIYGRPREDRSTSGKWTGSWFTGRGGIFPPDFCFPRFADHSERKLILPKSLRSASMEVEGEAANRNYPKEERAICRENLIEKAAFKAAAILKESN